METITFIGNGNMALSIAKGLQKDFQIEVVGRDMNKLEKFESNLDVKVAKSLMTDFNIDGKTIILCVKPNNIQEVGKLLIGKAKIVYSVLAGTTLETIEKNISSQSQIRTMPNVAASVNNSLTTITGDEKFKDEALKLFSAIGTTIWLGSEKEIDIATALAGSGPAYLALIAEALTDGAVKQGLKRADAQKITQGLFDGFAPLLQTMHPSILKDSVMSPGGTTAAGIGAMEKGNVRATCIDAIEKAYERACELGKGK
jgi:pyrroline-5-carboxylate reductase